MKSNSNRAKSNKQIGVNSENSKPQLDLIEAEYIQLVDSILQGLADHEDWNSKPIERIFECHAKLQQLDREYSALTPADQVQGVETQESNLRELKTWLTENTEESTCRKAIETSKLWDFFVHPNSFIGHGIKCSSDLKHGDVAILIPRKVILSAKFGKGRAKPIIPLLQSFEDNSVVQLAVCVMYHKIIGERSWFSPYFKCLPEHFSLPVFWDRSNFEALVDTATIKRCVYSVRASMMLYIRVLKTIAYFKIPEMDRYKCSWRCFTWGLSVVITRQNKIPLRKEDFERLLKEGAVRGSEFEGDSLALVPGWDMMNHEPGPATTDFDVDTDCLQYAAMRDFSVGEEMCMCYGQRQNELLLMYSGFTVANSPYECYDLEIAVPRDDLAKLRDLMLKNIGIPVDNSKISIGVSRNKDGKVTQDMFVAALAVVMTRADSAVLLRSIGNCSTIGSILDLPSLDQGTKSAAIELLRSNALAALNPINKAIVNVASYTEEKLLTNEHDQRQRGIANSCGIMLQGQKELLLQFLDDLESIAFLMAVKCTSSLELSVPV